MGWLRQNGLRAANTFFPPMPPGLANPYSCAPCPARIGKKKSSHEKSTLDYIFIKEGGVACIDPICHAAFKGSDRKIIRAEVKLDDTIHSYPQSTPSLLTSIGRERLFCWQPASPHALHCFRAKSVLSSRVVEDISRYINVRVSRSCTPTLRECRLTFSTTSKPRMRRSSNLPKNK